MNAQMTKKKQAKLTAQAEKGAAKLTKHYERSVVENGDKIRKQLGKFGLREDESADGNSAPMTSIFHIESGREVPNGVAILNEYRTYPKINQDELTAMVKECYKALKLPISEMKAAKPVSFSDALEDAREAFKTWRQSTFDFAYALKSCQDEYHKWQKKYLSNDGLAKELNIPLTGQRIGQLLNVANFFPREKIDENIDFVIYEDARKWADAKMIVGAKETVDAEYVMAEIKAHPNGEHFIEMKKELKAKRQIKKPSSHKLVITLDTHASEARVKLDGKDFVFLGSKLEPYFSKFYNQLINYMNSFQNSLAVKVGFQPGSFKWPAEVIEKMKELYKKIKEIETTANTEIDKAII